jgi:hypothetical protein
MADITLNAGDFIRPWKSPWGAFPTRSMKLSTGISSNAIKIGTVVGLDTDSTAYRDCVKPVPQSSGSLNPVAASIVGIAAETSTAMGSQNAQGTVIPVWDARPGIEYRARTRFGLLNSTIVGTTKELHRDSTLGIDVVSLRASSLATPANCVIVTGLLDASGDSGGAVTFVFNQSSGFLAFVS